MHDGSDLRGRTRDFALSIIRLYTSLPKSAEAQVLGRQMLRSGTSVGAHYREARRSRSTAEFMSKLQGGLQELEETAYWLELLLAAGIVPSDLISPIAREADQLLAIFVTTVKTAKQRAPTKGGAAF
jgi:four helix bundle protein